MVIPVGDGKVQSMVRVNKNPDGSVTEESFDDFSFVPMIQGKNN